MKSLLDKHLRWITEQLDKTSLFMRVILVLLVIDIVTKCLIVILAMATDAVRFNFHHMVIGLCVIIGMCLFGLLSIEVLLLLRQFIDFICRKIGSKEEETSINTCGPIG